MSPKKKKAPSKSTLHKNKKNQTKSNAHPSKIVKRGSGRPVSSTSADDIAFIAIAIQHERKRDETIELLSISYSVRQNGKRTNGVFELKGEKPLTFKILLGRILDAAHGTVFDKYPKHSYIVSHQTDLLFKVLKDGEDKLSELSQKGHTYFHRANPILIRRKPPIGRYRDESFWLIDTRNLMPGGGDLNSLKAFLNESIPSFLPDGSWQDLYGFDLENYSEIATNASDLIVDFAYGFSKTVNECLGEHLLYPTLGSLAEEFYVRELEDSNTDVIKLLGREKITDEKVRKATPLLGNLHLKETLAAECYHGGRNESFAFGPTTIDDWQDYDLTSAYPTALASVGVPAWENGHETTDLNEFLDQNIGVARVRFKFPESVRYPVLPVRAPGKLIFPLTGESFATAPEICLAHSLGAEITIINGFVIPSEKGKNPFLAPIQKSLELRSTAKAAGLTLSEKLHKSIANSIPGKMGQGLPPKRNSGEIQRKSPPCRITQPFIAAHVNGVIRATIGEILNRLPLTDTVVSVTTDGFITNSSHSEILTATSGPLCGMLKATRSLLTGASEIIEVKRRARQLLPIRTRVLATLENSKGAPPILSRSGILTPGKLRTENGKNEWLRNKFLNRKPNLRLDQESRENTGNPTATVFSVGLEYDFDRELIYTCDQDSTCGTHGAFRSRPWNSIEDYQIAATALSTFRKSACLRSQNDLIEFEDLCRIIRARKLHPALPKDPIAVLKTAKRTFLRALVKGEYGLEPYKGTKRKDLCHCINSALDDSPDKDHLTTSENDLKSAARTRTNLSEGSLPRTMKITRFLEIMTGTFPGFISEGLLTPVVNQTCAP